MLTRRLIALACRGVGFAMVLAALSSAAVAQTQPAPEIEGELHNGQTVFHRLPVPDLYDTLPQRKEPLDIAVVLGGPEDAPADG